MTPELISELRKLRNEIAHGLCTPAELAKRLSELGVPIPAAHLPTLLPAILQAFGTHAGLYVPQIMANILDGQHADVVCDPSAGFGAVLSAVRDATHATRALAFTRNEAEASLGKVLIGNAEWQSGDPLQLLSSLKIEIDVAASALPFGVRSDRPLTLANANGETVEIHDDLGNLILASSSMRLSSQGIGLFVVPPSFFLAERSVLRHFDALGLGVQAALALPLGSFGPHINMLAYLVIVGKRPTSRMFVAQLSSGDAITNLQILSNLKEGKEGVALDLGRMVDIPSFRGLQDIRRAERFKQAERDFGAPAVPLESLATRITLGRPDHDFEFPKHQNAVFIPLIGISDVVASADDLTLKRQNYAQVVIAAERSDARFVARFLNCEFGKEVREGSKSGAVIRKLNTQTLKGLRILVPDLPTQKAMLEIETSIAAEHNTLFSLQNELGELQRGLWSDPRSAPTVKQRLHELSARLSEGLKAHAVERLDQWFETLPFPLASILRAWHVTAPDDYKTKVDHLLDFFEGTVEFLGIILLSAFSSNESLFAAHKLKIKESLENQKLSFPRATFGTWKLVVEYLGKQTRHLLSGDPADRALCSDIFADPSFALSETLSHRSLPDLLSATNKMRNDWRGHGGVVGHEEARSRNVRLLGELEKLRTIMADTWAQVQLIQAFHCRPRAGAFENQIAVLMGSHTEFVKEVRRMSTWLDVERLYLSSKEGTRSLELLPLIQLGASPQSTKNACYFFSRLEGGGARFVSYHFLDQPELKGRFEEATKTITFLECDDLR